MALLEISHLSKHFGGLMALGDIDLQIEPGELLSIIGPNGSGKTTLFNMITGTYRPSAGRITFGGKEITGDKPHQIARYGIGRTFQRTTILEEMTALDNLIVGQRLHSRINICGAIVGTPSTRREDVQTREKARELLSFVGLAEKESQLAKYLSQEGKKRLSIAMALATNPQLLLLDEPAGGIYEEDIGGLLEVISKIRLLGITICLIEHKMKMVMSISDRVFVLSYGRNIAEGTPAEVVKNEAVIKAYLGENYAAQVG